MNYKLFWVLNTFSGIAFGNSFWDCHSERSEESGIVHYQHLRFLVPRNDKGIQNIISIIP